MRKPLCDVIAALPNAAIVKGIPSPEAPITMLCYDSRRAVMDSLFFCLTGKISDGHRFAMGAYRQGCRAFVVEHVVEDLPDDAVQFAVPDSRTALADCAAAFYNHPERKMRLVGLTGTKGKTTSALLMQALLNAAGIPTGYIGTNGIHFLTRHIETANSTPESVEIYHHLRAMLDHGVTACVMEVSSQALWMGRVRGLTFDTCLFTNLSPDHIGGVEHPDFEHYKACKRTLLTDYGASCIMVNADDPAAEDMIAGVNAPVTRLRLGNRPDADWSADDVRPVRDAERMGVSFTCTCHGQTLEGRHFLPLPGQFNVQNALCALAVACDRFGVEPAVALNALASAVITGRFETIHHPALPNVSFIIDYAHNGASMAAILDALHEYRPRRLICLFGSVGDRTFERRAQLAEAAAYRADLCILTSDNPGREDPDAIIAEIDAAFPADACPRLCIPDREEAIRRAVELAEEDDIILLAGKGHERYQLVGICRLPFCESDILLDAVGARAGSLMGS